jgi:hypothetical protein
MSAAFIFLLSVICLTSSAQLPELLLKDEAGIYKHAIDSAISIIKKEQSLRILYINALKCVSNYVPESMQEVAVVTNKRKVKRKRGKLKPDELILTVGCAQIVNGEAVVIIFTPEPSDWVFAFGYDFNPRPNQPKLLYVKRGTVEVQ